MEDNAITPAMVKELKRALPDDVGEIIEGVLAANKVTEQSTAELEHLSMCLSQLAESNEKYNTIVAKVRSQMSYLVTKI